MKVLNKTFLKTLFLLAIAAFAFLIFSSSSLAQNRSFAIQIASPTSEAEAQNLIEELNAKGVKAYLVKSEVPGKGVRYRVRVGKFSSVQNAKASGNELTASGAISEFAVMIYESPTVLTAAKREPKAKVKDKAKKDEPESEIAEAAKPEAAKTEEPKTIAKIEEQPKETTQQVTQPETQVVAVSKSEPVAAPAIPESKAVEVETKTENKAETKSEIKAESLAAAKTEVKPEPKPEPERKEVPPTQPEVTADLAVTQPTVEEDEAEPKIAAPSIADALTDAVFNNSNWKMVRRTAQTDKNLRTIHFVDSMTGWAAGDAGAVYRTTDGGRTWKPLLSGVSANINFIHFLDWNHGWMIGESTAKDDDEGETVLLSTINGGRTWMIQKIPYLLSVHFTDLQNGWAVGRNATLLHTTNGGTDWKPVEEIQSLVGLPVESSNYNFGFRDVYFLDGKHGWLIGNFYGRAQSNIGGLFVTADGGKSWKRIPLTLETQYVSGRFTPGLLHSVQFTDEMTGTVTGEMKDGESRFFFTLRTRDGGKTWEQFRTPSRATHSTHFLDLDNGWMAAFAPREGSAEAVVYDTNLMRTDNGGMSWQNDFTAKGSRIRSLFFLSPQKGWAVGDRGMILRYEEKTKAMN
ncbi:MAG: YCF48-related protein [Blastocatellales bacterium]